MLRDALLKQANWQQIAEQQRRTFFSRASSAKQSKGQMDEMLKALDFMCNLQPDKSQAPVGSCLVAFTVTTCLAGHKKAVQANKIRAVVSRWKWKLLEVQWETYTNQQQKPSHFYTHEISQK